MSLRLSDASRVFIKNFGDGNYMWPEAKAYPAVVLITDAKAQEFFEADDEAGYRAYVMSELRTSKGLPPDKGTSGLWWNTHKRFDSATMDDLLVHDDGQHLYWTQLTGEPEFLDRRPDPHPRGRDGAEVIVTFRPTYPWRKTSLKDVPLSLQTLHPHAPNVIRTRMTMAEAQEGNPDYIIALIKGEDTSHWHNLPKWVASAERSTQEMGRSFSDWEISAYDVVMFAKRASFEGGTEVITRKKDKPLGFDTDEELRNYVLELHSAQNGVCNLTGLAYTSRVGSDRGDLMMSLDRIDSSAGYVRGNLQLVCSFANRWKQADSNENFLVLIEIVRSNASLDKRTPV